MLFFPVALAAIAACISICTWIVLRQPRFGKLPAGERLARIKRSPNYSNGFFHNQEHTPSFTGKGGQFSAMAEYFLAPKKRLKPAEALPLQKTNLKNLDASRDIVVWLGHSSCYLQLDGIRMLVDPLFGSHASPFFFSTTAFKGDYPYNVPGIPHIDYLLFTHDHWDHLEHPTALALRDKCGLAVCPLGVGAHLEHWGYDTGSIFEGDWFDVIHAPQGLRIHFVPSRHFSGRTLKRNKSLWTGFVIESRKRKIYISGDGGYGKHFTEAGERFKGFDLALIENGQYDDHWKCVHMAPEESVQAVLDLHAKAALPVHSGRFSISNHSWDDPLLRFCAASQGKNYRLLTPVIGQPVFLDDKEQEFTQWWERKN